MAESRDITQLLQAVADGDNRAGDELFQSVYSELRNIARAHRKRWSGNDTLETSALVNEAYLKLVGKEFANYRDRAHFFATASRAMRQVLINYAERMATAKRGSNVRHVTLSGVASSENKTFDEILEIDRLLQKLERENTRHCRLFECRVFGGMTIEETANALGISSATVKRDWALVSAWVYREMQPSFNA